jgi:hypothetical protein
MLQTKTQKRQLTAEDLTIIGQLLVETLADEITPQTRKAVYSLGNPLEIPRPYGHIVGYTQGYALSNKELAHDLQTELRIICQELLDGLPQD